ncbi:hypothetical protein EST38_g2938 [Candolleomyces aberdarensis]|uniref:Uncharacterized protein n=1 Tax=Candolleomyces aberdarensis TaxID=2316362 RepID=A0A4V1Q4Q7_9AGAR|nr:hypothetical protein EST38_g2938 [Candolleomyces aberdarensis]
MNKSRPGSAMVEGRALRRLILATISRSDCIVWRLDWLADRLRRRRRRIRAIVLTDDRDVADEEDEEVDEDDVDTDDAELPLLTPRAHREMASSTTAVIAPRGPPNLSDDEDEDPDELVVTELASSLGKGGSPR